MKIRIKGNSLRYRLTRSDVVQLATKGFLKEEIVFANNTLIYAIETAKENKLSADFIDSKIILKMSQQMIDELMHTNTVGFNDDSGAVSLLVEKDFACIDNTTEDQSDNYPNPSINCK